ncbi:hypothetical protein [Pseudotamlana agarivorans]|uniref:hypothetical protein n=1 Tax=Pseudotamlana agarivorans TaxID=481183 RepID=UPI0012FA39CF|nr:hypothetical protein [Tamlana agarivorans]
MQEYFEYEDLYKHQGTENYEVVIIYNENSIIKEKLIEEKQQFLSVIGRDEKQKISARKKVDFLGNTIDKFIIYKTLSDGTLWGSEHYVNWLLNGDTTKHDYIDPLTNEDKKNWGKYSEKFDELYNKASCVYENFTGYYFKVDNKWFKIEEDPLRFKDCPENFTKLYPAKDPKDIRMLPLKESMEDLMKSKTIKVVDYIQQDSEKGIGLNPIKFSSGYYMLELYLPQGDTLKFRRYGAMGVSSEMFVYQIPKALGGSDQVFFIEQEPNSMYPNKSFAGFYAIRPKNYKQLPEYKFQLEKEHQQAVEKRIKILEK